MNRLYGVLLAASALLATGAWAETSVGVSIGINQPGVYGRIDIGNYPAPVVVYAQPIVIAPPRVAMRPVYLYVPPGHQKNWAKHCSRYDACGRPVYFVKESWVRERYDEEHSHGHGSDGKGKNKGKGNKH